MNFIEMTLLLFLVIDPFGNLPLVLAVLAKFSAQQYRRAIIREMLLALLALLVFALVGEQILSYMDIERDSLDVAGGVILFLISLKMIFRSASEIFDDGYGNDPFLVPIAVPSLAGPSAITTVMILRIQQQVDLVSLFMALLSVCLVTCGILLVGRRISAYLGPRGVNAMEKFMGILLNLVAVNMILRGIKDFLLT